jgi:hypothetical protein
LRGRYEDLIPVDPEIIELARIALEENTVTHVAKKMGYEKHGRFMVKSLAAGGLNKIQGFRITGLEELIGKARVKRIRLQLQRGHPHPILSTGTPGLTPLTPSP